MIKVLRGLMSSEKGTGESFRVKLDLIRQLLYSIHIYAKVERKFLHVIKRLERITSTSDEQLKQKSMLLQQSGKYMVDYEELLEQLKTQAKEVGRNKEEGVDMPIK